MANLETVNDDVLYIICDYVYQKIEISPHRAQVEASRGVTGHIPTTATDLCGDLTDMRSLSMASKRLRVFAAPWIFRDVGLRGRCEEVSEALQMMEKNPALMDHVRALKFRMVSVPGKFSPPLNNLAYRLLKILKNMSKLSELHISIPSEYMDDVADVFEEAFLSLPKIKTLVLGRFDDFIVKHCPNVETISTSGCHLRRSHKRDSDPSIDLIYKAGKAENLTYFEMSHFWSCAQLEAIVKYMPNIKTLAMTGGHYSGPMRFFLPYFSHLSHLETLVLIDVSLLHYNFNPPGSGNNFMKPSNAQYQEVLHGQGRVAERRVADAVFGASRSISEIWIGNWSCATWDRNGGLACFVEPVKWKYEERTGVW